MGTIYGSIELPERKEKYHVITDDVVESADICIIGSGAAGAVLAKELVEQGKKVILLERGGYYEGQDMNQRDADMLPLLWKSGGFSFDDSLRIAIAQGSCLGGSTIINDAVCFDPPQRVKDQWAQMGVDFTEKEWSEHTSKVNKTLHVTEVSDDELNRNSLMLLLGAKRMRFREHRKNYRNCVNCMQCGFCHLGCHYDTKQNVLVTYLHEALKKPDSKIKVYCNCYVDKIIHKNGVVEGVEGTFRDSRATESFRIRVNAKVVIVSAGAIASSKILLSNNIAQKTAGRGLCLHPAPFVIGDFDFEIKGNQGVPMSYTIHDFGVSRTQDQTRQEHGFDGGEFLIESIFLPLLQFAIGIPAGGLEHAQLLQRYNNCTMAGVLIRDGNNGRVALTPNGRTSVTYEPGPKDLQMIAKGVEILSNMWFDLGAKQIVTSYGGDFTFIKNKENIPQLVEKILKEPKNLFLGSAHPQSGNKIGTDPNDSVVDSNCRVHGFENLFVCDASVFPTSVGVNPQITVMTVASITAHRIARDWTKYAKIHQSKSIGETCDITQPMYCLRKNLSKLFDSVDTKYEAGMLVNGDNEKPDESNWSFDPQTLMITNDTHWKGIFTRDGDVQSVLMNYLGGFWKRFTKNGDAVAGITHPYEAGVYAANRAVNKNNLTGFGKCILLEYTQPGFDQFYDVLKLVDKNTILGKAFMGFPRKGAEIMTFSMSRRYPLEFMSEDDHDMLYNRMKKPKLQNMVGIWEGYLVSDSARSPNIFRFRFFFGKDGQLQNYYVFGNTLSGIATLHEKEDHIEMRDLTGEMFHDEIREINENILIGRYYSESNPILQFIPSDVSFLHSDKARSRIYLQYILKRVGDESAFREYHG